MPVSRQRPRTARKAVILGTLLALLLAAGVAAAHPGVWDAASDFRLAPRAANPNPGAQGHQIWHYMESSSLAHDPSSYSLLPEFITDRFHIEGLQSWQGTVVSHDEKDKLPSVAVNATGDQFPLGVFWPAGTMVVHPLPGQLVVVGWRSPKAGVVAITGSVTDRNALCGDGFDWSIDHGATTLVSGTVPNGGAESFADASGAGVLDAVQVKKHEFLYFVVGPGPNGDHACDWTGLTVTIRQLRKH